MAVAYPRQDSESKTIRYKSSRLEHSQKDKLEMWNPGGSEDSASPCPRSLDRAVLL